MTLIEAITKICIKHGFSLSIRPITGDNLQIEITDEYSEFTAVPSYKFKITVEMLEMTEPSVSDMYINIDTCIISLTKHKTSVDHHE